MHNVKHTDFIRIFKQVSYKVFFHLKDELEMKKTGTIPGRLRSENMGALRFVERLETWALN